MFVILRLAIVALLTTLTGCAMTSAVPAAPLSLPLPKRSDITSHAGDYRGFIAMWTGVMSARGFEKPFPMMPSDARWVPVADSGKTLERQRRAIVTAFDEWCKDSKGTGWSRADDMVSPGHSMAVCESNETRKKLAALRIQPEPLAEREGRYALYVEHWYPPDIDRYIRELREEANRTSSQQIAIETAKREERKANDRAVLDQMTLAARTRSTSTCQRFERESNALLARFTVALSRVELRRYSSDLAVAFDECTSSKTLPAAELIGVYRFNLESFSLLGDVWDAHLLPPCQVGVTCNVQGRAASAADQREMGELQSRFPALRQLAAPERASEITDRVRRFVLDR